MDSSRILSLNIRLFIQAELTLKGNNKSVGGDGMIAWYWAVVALIAGALFGILIVALLQADRN